LQVVFLTDQTNAMANYFTPLTLNVRLTRYLVHVSRTLTADAVNIRGTETSVDCWGRIFSQHVFSMVLVNLSRVQAVQITSKQGKLIHTCFC